MRRQEGKKYETQFSKLGVTPGFSDMESQQMGTDGRLHKRKMIILLLICILAMGSAKAVGSQEKPLVVDIEIVAPYKS